MSPHSLRDSVLIADSDVERGSRIAHACAECGIDVEIATHGARALEIALAELPVAMVAQLDLPLIEGTRLSEILRANPRTEGMGILFIADERTAPLEKNAGGRVIPGHADPETIARFVEALLLKHRPARRDAGTEPVGGIEGELAQLALGELIELFHVNRKTGRILLERGSARRRQTGQVVLSEGDVVHASVGAVEGEKALYRLFAWNRGHFTFVPDAEPCEPSIERPTRALLREGRRQISEWDRLVEELPPRNTRVGLLVTRAELPNVLHPLTQEVLMVLEVSDRVEDVLDRCSFPDYQVLRTLTTLKRRGLIELDHDAGGASVRGGPAVLPPAFTTRLRERLDRQREGVEAKVLVIGAPGAGPALAGLIARLPGAKASRPPAGESMGTLARLELDDETAIEWVFAPPRRRFAPIWPLATHGALAVVFAHAGPLEGSVRALRYAIDQVARLPRVRVLHALLSDKPGEVAAAALCETLSLFDDRSVVEIRLDAPEAAETGLRELLRRVLA